MLSLELAGLPMRRTALLLKLSATPSGFLSLSSREPPIWRMQPTVEFIAEALLGLGLRVKGLGFWVSGSGLRFSSFGFKDFDGGLKASPAPSSPQVLEKGSASGAREEDVKQLLAQEMSYLESLCVARPKQDD